MIDEGNDWSSPLDSGVPKKIQVFQRFLAQRSETLATRNKDGSTPLHWAVLDGDVDVVRLLVEHVGDSLLLMAVRVNDGLELEVTDPKEYQGDVEQED